MSKQWCILVVEDEENLNRNIVTSLRRDGYFVQGVVSEAEAIRTLWSEEYHVVICGLKMPSADGFELLQWIRAYRPDTRVIIVGTALTRMQALESGAVSYLEKPLDLHVLKEELRRLLHQTGFSASLDSFDLLDVIQIITMSRKTIALVVNTGLEERGVLRFQAGELVWAEYGTLLGEEAFFALAAHKNGTVIHQPWNEQITPNVKQPLSRLIFQALQYREKYAAYQQLSGEHAAISNAPTPHFLQQDEVDDSPFLVLAEAEPATAQAEKHEDESREWWQQSQKHPQLNKSGNVGAVTDAAMSFARREYERSVPGKTDGAASTPPATTRKEPVSEHPDLPSWLMDQPTQFEMPVLRPSSLSGTSPSIPATPINRPAPAEWQPPQAIVSQIKTPAARKQTTGSQKLPKAEPPAHKASSPEWQPPEQGSKPSSQSGPMQSIAPSRRQSGAFPAVPPVIRRESARELSYKGPASTSPSLVTSEKQVDVIARSPIASGDGVATSPRRAKRNYPGLINALQSLGYSVPGFVATAIVSMDGQPIAQVAIDELDISPMCGHLGNMLQSILLAMEQGKWGQHEETVITSSTYYILLRIIGSARDVFHVLMTTRDINPADSLEVMANVEGAIETAL
jgi:DNA-binding response OmpR family regulator/predicted regulator of Ras-like GTPase activity (Roadblock/LC7/MglB family)